MRISDWSSDVCSSDLFGSAGSQSPQTPSMRGTPGEAPQPRIVTFIGAPASGASGRPTVGNRLARYLVEQAQAVLRRLLGDFAHAHALQQSGRASRRERVSQYLSVSVVRVALKPNTSYQKTQTRT